MNRLYGELEATTVEKLRGGEGHVVRRQLFSPEETFGRTRLCAIQTVPPGCSIGIHRHGEDAELIHVLSGSIVMHDNGTDRELTAGDTNFAGGGGSHGVTNKSDADAVLLCVVMA